LDEKRPDHSEYLKYIENSFSKRKPLKYLDSFAFIMQGMLTGEERAKLEYIVRNEDEFNKIVT